MSHETPQLWRHISSMEIEKKIFNSDLIDAKSQERVLSIIINISKPST